MHCKLLVFPVLTLSILSVTLPAYSQVAPAYQQKGGWPIEVGAGGVSYDVDWGHGRMYGGAAWIDYYPRFLPSFLQGLGVEAEARDITLDEHQTQPNMRQDTGEGGPIYAWRHFQSFHPYGKFLIGHGSVDFVSPNPNYHHDTRTVWAPGGGLEYRFFRNWWVRGDYEYQIWTINLLGKTLDPQGFTVGFAYDFARPHRNKN